MRQIKVTNENKDKFYWAEEYEMLEVFDEALHDRGLELVLAKEDMSTHRFYIAPTLEDGKYDKRKARNILYGR